MSPPTSTYEELWATAIHEAGHAVIARVLGLPCGNVEIGLRGKANGLCVIADPQDTLGAWHVAGKTHRTLQTAQRAKIITYMAGGSAEEECIGRSRGGDFDDLFCAATLILSLIGDENEYPDGLTEGEGYQRRLRIVTDHLVRRHRKSIEGLARVLLLERIMTDKRVRSVIGLPSRRAAVAKRHSEPRYEAPDLMDVFGPDPTGGLREMRNLGIALQMIREAIEDCAPPGSVPSREYTMPEP
jgi:hypothetical protein